MSSTENLPHPRSSPSPPLRKRFAFVWRYLRRHPWQLVLGVLSMIGRDAFAFAIPLLIRSAVETLTHTPGSGSRWTVPWIGLAMLGVAIPRSGFQTMSRLNIISTSRDVEYAMRRDMLRHLFRLDAGFWATARTGDIMAYATNDLTAVRMMLGPGMISLFESIISLPVAVVVMALVDWRLALACMAPAPLAVFLLILFGNIISVRFDAIQAQFATMSAAVQQTIAGARVVRSFVREGAEQRRFEAMNLLYLRSNRNLGAYASSLDPLLTFTTGLSVLIVLAYGGRQVLSHRLDVGSFVMFTTYVAMLVRPISSLGRVVNLMQRGMASVGRLQVLFAETPIILPESQTDKSDLRQSGPASLVLRKVSVAYGSFLALDAVDLHIEAGSTVAILGETGSGKSTLVRLITRLIDPSAGAVLMNGVDCRHLGLSALRSAVAVVPQDTFLFSISLAANIALGTPGATEAQIRAAAEMAGLAPDLATLPEGFQTVVGERGIMLSGGQKQRVAIARAILTNPRVLVLDDALSSVDSVTEQRILNHLKSVMAERTTVLITHRVATAMQADQIVVLDRGRVVERGTHASLLARGKHYASLARLQTFEQELEVL